MAKITTVYCDLCRRQSTGEDDYGYWHRLDLVRKDHDFIPPRAKSERVDLCSDVCLHDYVEKVTAYEVAKLTTHRRD